MHLLLIPIYSLLTFFELRSSVVTQIENLKNPVWIFDFEEELMSCKFRN